ncbi:MAG: tetratricopeptide repeat protein, partial [Planctomycetota bacterium]
RIADAIEIRQEQLEQFPQLWDAWRILGDLLHAEGRYEEVIPGFRRAIEAQPSNANLQRAIAWSLVKHPGNEMYADWALELAKKSQAARKMDSYSLDVLGVANFRVRNFDAAIQSLERAAIRHEFERGEHAALYPALARRAMRQCIFAQIAYERNEIDQAQSYLNQAEQELAPWSMATNVDRKGLWGPFVKAAHSFLCETRELLKVSLPENRVDVGIRRLEEFVERYPDDAWGVERLSTLYAWFGRVEERSRLSHEALGKLRDDDTAGSYHQRSLGVLLMPNAPSELTQQAIETARAAMEKPNVFAWEKLTHGIAELRAGNFELAEQRFDEVIGIAGGYTDNAAQDRFTIALLRRSVARARLGRMNESADDFERAKDRITFPLPPKTELTQDTERVTRLRVWLAYEEAAELFGESATTKDALEIAD